MTRCNRVTVSPWPSTLKPSGNCLPVHQGLLVINQVLDPRPLDDDPSKLLASRKSNLTPDPSSYLRAFTSRLMDLGSSLRMVGFFKGTITPYLDILISSKCLTIHRRTHPYLSIYNLTPDLKPNHLPLASLCASAYR